MIPSIDLMKGKVVQLEQGRKLKLQRKNIDKIAKQFAFFNHAKQLV